MKVFISWSGPVSQRLARILRDWLPNVMQSVQPYFSDLDIDKGARWNASISSELESSDFGIVCVTTTNTSSSWIMFEAGSLSKKVGSARVVPILFDLNPSEIEGPLTQFQAARFTKQGMHAVLVSMNNALSVCGEAPLEGQRLETIFEKWWDDLERLVIEALATPDDSPKNGRTTGDMIEEILSLTRTIARTQTGDGAEESLTIEVLSLADRFSEVLRQYASSKSIDVDDLEYVGDIICGLVEERRFVRAKRRLEIVSEIKVRIARMHEEEEERYGEVIEPPE